MPRRAALFLTSAALLWTAAIFLAPLLHGHPAGAVVGGSVRVAGGLVCHQRPDRSFQVAGQTMPVCARCTGLYLSGAAGALAAWLTVPVMPRRTRTTVLVAAAPTLIAVAGEWAGVAQPGNVVRALAALPVGAACGWLFVRLLRAEAAPATCAIIS
jgi:uncharacterized membrane protein